MKEIYIIISSALLYTAVCASDEAENDDGSNNGSVPTETVSAHMSAESPSSPESDMQLSPEMQEAFNNFCRGLTENDKTTLQQSDSFAKLEAPENAADDYWLKFYQNLSALVRDGMNVEQRIKLATMWYAVQDAGDEMMSEYKTASEGLSDDDIISALNKTRSANRFGFSTFVAYVKTAKEKHEENIKKELAAKAAQAKRRNPFARLASAEPATSDKDSESMVKSTSPKRKRSKGSPAPLEVSPEESLVKAPAMGENLKKPSKLKPKSEPSAKRRKLK